MKRMIVEAAAMSQDEFYRLDRDVQMEYVEEAMQDAIAASPYPIDTWAMWLNVTLDQLRNIYVPLKRYHINDIPRKDVRAVQDCLRELFPDYEQRGLEAGN